MPASQTEPLPGALQLHPAERRGERFGSPPRRGLDHLEIQPPGRAAADQPPELGCGLRRDRGFERPLFWGLPPSRPTSRCASLTGRTLEKEDRMARRQFRDAKP